MTASADRPSAPTDAQLKYEALVERHDKESQAAREALAGPVAIIEIFLACGAVIGIGTYLASKAIYSTGLWQLSGFALGAAFATAFSLFCTSNVFTMSRGYLEYIFDRHILRNGYYERATKSDRNWLRYWTFAKNVVVIAWIFSWAILLVSIGQATFQYAAPSDPSPAMEQMPDELPSILDQV